VIGISTLSHPKNITSIVSVWL